MKDSAHNEGSLNGTVNSIPRSPRQTGIISDETIPLRRAKGVDPSCRALLSMMIKFNIYRHKNGSWIQGMGSSNYVENETFSKIEKTEKFQSSVQSFNKKWVPTTCTVLNTERKRSLDGDVFLQSCKEYM